MIRKAKVIPDKNYLGMFRVQWPDKKISDMVNLSRANDTARRWNDSERVRQNSVIRRAAGAGMR